MLVYLDSNFFFLHFQTNTLVLVRKAVRALINQHVIGSDAFNVKEPFSPSEKADALEVPVTSVFGELFYRVLQVIAFSFSFAQHPIISS